jgi:hypothetical protein
MVNGIIGRFLLYPHTTGNAVNEFYYWVGFQRREGRERREKREWKKEREREKMGRLNPLLAFFSVAARATNRLKRGLKVKNDLSLSFSLSLAPFSLSLSHLYHSSGRQKQKILINKQNVSLSRTYDETSKTVRTKV